MLVVTHKANKSKKNRAVSTRQTYIGKHCKVRICAILSQVHILLFALRGSSLVNYVNGVVHRSLLCYMNHFGAIKTVSLGDGNLKLYSGKWTTQMAANV